MSHECTHILPSGQKCKAPAVNGRSRCRHHGPRKPVGEPSFVLPEFNDERSLLRAVSAVLHAASRRRLKRSEAGTFLFGLQLASRLIGNSGSRVAIVHRSEQESCEPAPEPLNPETPMYYPTTMEEAGQFLATMESKSVEQAFDEWAAKHQVPPLNPCPGPRMQLSRGIPPSVSSRTGCS